MPNLIPIQAELGLKLKSTQKIRLAPLRRLLSGLGDHGPAAVGGLPGISLAHGFARRSLKLLSTVPYNASAALKSPGAADWREPDFQASCQ
jgi:hypothetical protein